MKKPLDQTLESRCRAAVAALAYRGPDAEGHWVDSRQGVFLGHRRLAIIGLGDDGAQPMARGASVISYNGEIYNYRELAERLVGLGVRLTSNSDTEVLLQAWRRWGTQTLDEVDGMFAFALWDGQAGYLATDPFGEKPMYVAETVDGVIAASELSAIRGIVPLSPEISERDWAEYFALGQLSAPRTAFGSHVHRMPPGSVWRIEKGRIASRQRYWEPRVGEPGKGPVQPVSEAELSQVERALSESLERRFVADVPVALFLSAGVDSSLMAALARRVLGLSPRALTVSFKEDGSLDESDAAAAIARELSLPHDILPYRARPQDSSPEVLLSLMGQLNANTGALPIYQVASAAAAKGCKVALTGMGGDEVSYGYGKNAFYWRWRRFLGLPVPVRSACASLGWLAGGRVGRIAKRLGGSMGQLYIANKLAPAAEAVRALPGFDPWMRDVFGPSSAFDSRPVELAVPAFELTQLMADQQLVSADHASMRTSLELRTPFLSRRVQETLAALDPRALLAYGQKNVLRRVLARHLPPTFFDRPKSGFIMPQSRLLSGIEETPVPNGFDPRWCQDIWNRRNEGRGWQLLAVRLLMSERFLTSAAPGGA